MVKVAMENWRLEAANQRLASALDQVRDVVVILDAHEGAILHANTPFAHLFGTSSHWAPRTTFRELFDGSALASALDQACVGLPWTGCSSLKTYSGKRITFDGSVAPLCNAEGKVDSLVVRLQDISQEVERHHHIRQAQKMETLGVMAGGMAHDFNNLIGAILNAAELIEAQIEPGSPIRKKVEIIQRVGGRAKALSKQVLNFSHRTEDHWTPFELRPLVLEVINVLQTTLPPNVELHSDLASEIWILGDPSQMHQVVMNLGINASQAMQPQGGVLSIRLQQVESNLDAGDRVMLESCALLSLEDTGCGMDQVTLDRIFEPFFTTKDLGQGTGLGLSVVHGIIQGHRGHMQVTSEPGKGSAFKISLPLLPGPPSGQHLSFLDQS